MRIFVFYLGTKKRKSESVYKEIAKNDCENEHIHVATSFEEMNYDEYIDNLNDLN